MLRHLASFLLPLLLCGSVSAAPLEFHLRFDPKVHARPYTGRVYVMLFKDRHTTLQRWPNWFSPEPCFIRDVKNWKPGERLVLDRTTRGYPIAMDRVTRGAYTVQAVIDVHPDHPRFSVAPGNVYTIDRMDLGPESGPIEINLNRVYTEPAFKESDRIKLVDVESKGLTAFHGRSTRLRAAVILPASYGKNQKKSYPTVYEIPGFSGTHHLAHRIIDRNPTDVAGIEVLHVVLDPSCRHGHHVFADSANNGPVGRALVEELIPAIEKAFRAIPRPEARLLTGHSSGGWSSLWLQTRHPDFFGGCWSTAPDAMDFRDFQRINLYRPGENMFTDREGNRRPIARKGKTPMLWYRDFSDMEDMMAHGGQLAAFEAVFSERGPDGQPRRLWDRKTGAIDPEVARSWEKYDIRLVLERNWKTLGPRLSGKLHVYMGDLDTFYLEGATVLLRESLAKLGSDAVVVVFPGKDHSTLMDRPLRTRMNREMAARLRAAKVVD